MRLYEVVCTKNGEWAGLCLERNKDRKPTKVLDSNGIEYSGAEILDWVNTKSLMSKEHWREWSFYRSTEDIFHHFGIAIKKSVDEKICPIMMSGNKNPDGHCIGEQCGWWCKFANDCSVPLLAGMFADSEICRNVFDQL